MEVKCNGSATLPLKELTEFQGGLKNRTRTDVDKIITSIHKFGFVTPFFVWNYDGINHVLDGHDRLMALKIMRQQVLLISKK
ncbi:MAG: ParB N-terminal domain-containing protein [Treponema sp.]|nr:ParB N-terminal domain-containing protein [Treponema sp.]